MVDAFTELAAGLTGLVPDIQWVIWLIWMKNIRVWAHSCHCILMELLHHQENIRTTWELLTNSPEGPFRDYQDQLNAINFYIKLLKNIGKECTPQKMLVVMQGFVHTPFTPWSELAELMSAADDRGARVINALTLDDPDSIRDNKTIRRLCVKIQTHIEPKPWSRKKKSVPVHSEMDPTSIQIS